MKYTIVVCIVASCLAIDMFSGCSDMGTDPGDVSTRPTILRIQPDSAFVGDTITIIGANFGMTQSSSTIHIGGTLADMIVSWSDSTIRVKVPAGSASGAVVITVDEIPSNATTFSLHIAAPVVSFSANVLPIFLRNGCLSCHGGLGGLVVATVAQLLKGGDHGPAIVPGNAAASHLVQKLSLNPPFGDRMPFGGAALPDSTIQVIRNWINQGALNN